MINEDLNMKSRKDQLDSKIQQRNDLRESKVEAEKECKVMLGQTSTEDLVAQFYKDLETLTSEVEDLFIKVEILPKNQLNAELDNITFKIKKTQDFVTDAGIFLPSYDARKSQSTVNALSNTFYELQDKVKPKKKFGFKNSKHKQANNSQNVSEIKEKSETDGCSAKKILSTNSCSLSGLDGERVTLTRDKVASMDVSLEKLSNCHVFIQGAPSTLHMSSIKNCTILTGPVSTSVFVDGCSNSKLIISCQQLRTHSTTDTDVYLHTTSKAIIEDCHNIRVAPYNWEYSGIDNDFLTAGLNRDVNNWKEVGDFNWLATDKPSPNWTFLPESEIQQNWCEE